jgi:biotin operon repressor
MESPASSCLYCGGKATEREVDHAYSCAGCEGRARPARRPPPDYVRLTVTTLRLLRVAPVRAADIAALLGVTRRTVERILRGLEDEGENVTREKSGREVFYRIAKEKP